MCMSWLGHFFPSLIGDLGMVEQILKVISRELSVVEVMQVFKGQVEPAQRLQPGLFNFVREKLLDGEIPTKERKDQAVTAFLENCIPSLERVEVSQFVFIRICDDRDPLPNRMSCL